MYSPGIFLIFLSVLCVVNTTSGSQNFFTSSMDATRNALMPFYRGSSSLAMMPVLSHSSVDSKPVSFGSLGGKHLMSVTSSRYRLASSRRRRRYYKKVSSVRRRTTPSNTFLEALDEIEKAVYEARASRNRYRYNSRRFARLEGYIKLAAGRGSYRFARQALGRAIFMTTSSRSRGKRSTSNAASNFMKALKKDLGNEKFDKFMAVYGDTTLIFAIDDTGSMYNEIQAAKDIATSIVNTVREIRVNYILSPFNDPGTGPLTYKSESQGKEFVRAINSLRAYGGGDYPELTFKGMLDAISMAKVEPRWGSNMYVFTDATAKDATEENIGALLDYAVAFGLTINFFTTFTNPYKPFEKIARETCGLMIKLPNSSELKKLKDVTATSLKGETCMEDGSSSDGRRKRSATTVHPIQVDESVTKLLISVTTRNSYPTITLKDPSARIVTHKKIVLTKGAIYELSYPRAGSWKLLVAASAGKHEVVVKGTSKTNIDFEHFFVMIPTRGRSKLPFPISHPLSGKKSHLVLTVAGAEKIRANTLSLELVDSKTGRQLSKATVKPRGTTGAHFVSSFVPPRSSFRLVLKGKTKRGYNFRRMSRNIIKPKTALVRITYARNDFTIPRGGRSFVIFVIHNVGPTEVFDISIKDRLGFRVRKGRRIIRVRKGRKRMLSVWFKAPSGAELGKSNSVVLSITGRKSRVRSGQIINLIVA